MRIAFVPPRSGRAVCPVWSRRPSASRHDLPSQPRAVAHALLNAPGTGSCARFPRAGRRRAAFESGRKCGFRFARAGEERALHKSKKKRWGAFADVKPVAQSKVRRRNRSFVRRIGKQINVAAVSACHAAVTPFSATLGKCDVQKGLRGQPGGRRGGLGSLTRGSGLLRQCLPSHSGLRTRAHTRCRCRRDLPNKLGLCRR